MTSDAIQIVQFLFTMIWSLFTSWSFPGTNVTPAAMAFLILTAFLIIKIVKNFFGGDSDAG